MRLAVAVALTLCGTTAPAAAQQPRATGTVVGFAADSIHGVPLSNAFVVLEGSVFGAASDAEGNFVIQEVPAGSYRAVLLHELLDVLQLTVGTEPITVSAGDTLRIFLGVPSAATVLHRACGAGPSERDTTAALFGVVTDADGRPADGATVLLRWTQILVSREYGLSEGEQYRASVSLPNGVFRICGLPDDLVAEGRVARGPDTSGTVPVRIPPGGVAVVQFGLPEGRAAAEAGAEPVLPQTPGSAVVRGTVTDRRGQPIARARFWTADPATGTESDSAGRFALIGQPAGSQTLTVRRLGYEMLEIPLLLRRGQRLDVEMVLDDFVPLLDEIVVRARRDAALERVGFAARERAGGGFYVRPEDLARRFAARLSDYLVEAPMLRVTGSGSNRRVQGWRGTGPGCVAYALDGQPWTGPPPDETLNPQEVAAMEVYPRGLAPALFLGIGDCEVVLIWTRRHLALE